MWRLVPSSRHGSSRANPPSSALPGDIVRVAIDGSVSVAAELDLKAEDEFRLVFTAAP